MAPVVKMRSSNNEILEFDEDSARMSLLISSMLDDMKPTDGNDVVLPLPKVSSAILRKAMEWAEHHKNSVVVVSEWDREFFDVDVTTKCDLILASKYLDIPGLHDFSCNAVAEMIRGKSAEEIRIAFGLDDDAEPSTSRSSANVQKK